ncbi:hypothetical protein M153_5000012966 [Pseudoloma neurophilia]|uniref:Uncharacterized protein n=1 Tax=Pseudoloma neurophilia TaxID=146866 RepID=A0A0R0M119_9MICR|nr:hypothetical protein M153_5000012966 [Pseudoloma neurophilia]
MMLETVTKNFIHITTIAVIFQNWLSMSLENFTITTSAAASMIDMRNNSVDIKIGQSLQMFL